MLPWAAGVCFSLCVIPTVRVVSAERTPLAADFNTLSSHLSRGIAVREVQVRLPAVLECVLVMQTNRC